MSIIVGCSANAWYSASPTMSDLHARLHNLYQEKAELTAKLRLIYGETNPDLPHLSNAHMLL